MACGDVGLLVELEDLDAALVLHAELESEPLPGTVELVLATRTVLVRIDPQVTSVAQVRHALEGRRTRRGGERQRGEVVEIPVRYDGEDLAEVGAATGLGPRGVIAAHTGQVWTVAFVGFAPGFGYLVGEDERLHVSRRPHPRNEVPVGAVGLAGEFSGIYPRRSPGGWQLIGRTELTMWDVERSPPALLQPGTQVRFVELT